MTECRCGRPTEVIACETCADALTKALAEVAWLDDELDVTQSGQRALPTEGSAPSPEKPLPWNEAAGDARRHLHGLLVSWVRLCHEEAVTHQSPKAGLPDDNLPSLSRWLLWRVDGLARHEAGGEAVDEITSAVARCRRVIDRMPKREYVGPCECGKDLYRRPSAATVTCRGCAAEYDPEQMLTWMRDQVADRLVTVREGAGLLAKFGVPVPLDTAKKWATRKQLEVRGTSVDGASVYAFGDLLALATKGGRESA